MLKVTLESVRGLSFKGYINVCDLSETQKAELAIGTDFSAFTVEVEGDFSVCGEMDDGQIDDISCYAFNGIHDLDLNEENADIDSLCEAILDTDIGQQLYERAMMRAEAYADSMEDR